MQQQSIAVFRNHYLSTDATMASVVTSEAIPVAGNQVNMAAMVIHATASVTTLTFQLQGSIDGNAWLDISSGSFNQATFGYNQLTTAAGDFPYPFVRVVVTLVGTTESALFDVTLGLSDQ